MLIEDNKGVDGGTRDTKSNRLKTYTGYSVSLVHGVTGLIVLPDITDTKNNNVMKVWWTYTILYYNYKSTNSHNNTNLQESLNQSRLARPTTSSNDPTSG